jgi:hypothetical protein
LAWNSIEVPAVTWACVSANKMKATITGSVLYRNLCTELAKKSFLSVMRNNIPGLRIASQEVKIIKQLKISIGMKNLTLFGNKETFAIQIETGSKPDKNKLCYWVVGRKVGNFTKGGEIETIRTSYQKFQQQNEAFYLPELEPFRLEQLREFFAEGLFELVASASMESVKEYQRRRKYLLKWGIQVDGFDVILLSKPNCVLFFYTPGQESKLEIVPNDIFRSVFDEFFKFCDDNKLV